MHCTCRIPLFPLFFCRCHSEEWNQGMVAALLLSTLRAGMNGPGVPGVSAGMPPAAGAKIIKAMGQLRYEEDEGEDEEERKEVERWLIDASLIPPMGVPGVLVGVVWLPGVWYAAGAGAAKEHVSICYAACVLI